MSDETPTPTHRSGPAAPSLAVTDDCHAAPGEQGIIRVHARNVSAVAQSFTVTVLGLELGWLPGTAVLPNVAPDATVTFEIPLTPSSGTAAATYPFTVAVEARAADSNGLDARSAHAAASTSVVSCELVVDDRSDVVLSIEPADARGVFSSKVHIVVANAGQADAQVELRTAVERGLSVHLARSALSLRPHETARIPTRLRTRRPRIMGHSDRRSYTVTATGTLAAQRFQGSFHSRPLLPSGIMQVLVLLLVMALWAGGAVVALPWLSNQVKTRTTASQDAEIPPVVTPADGSASTPDDDSATPGGATGGGTTADGTTTSGGDDATPSKDDATQTVAAPTVRISGAVSGSAASDVTVTVSPASALMASGIPSAGSTTNADAAALGSTPGYALVADRRNTPPYEASGGVTRVLSSVSHAASSAVRSGLASVGLVSNATAPVGKVFGTSVALQRAGTSSQARSTSTGKDGTWALAGMSSTARYLVVLTKPGYQTQRYLVTGADAATTPIETTLIPGEGQLTGTVTGPAGATGGVTISISDGTTTVTTRSATTGDIGRWSVTGLSTPSSYLVSAASDELGAQSKLVQLPASGSATVDLTLRSGVATLRGKVVGTDRLGAYGGIGGLTVSASDGTTTRSASTTTTAKRAGSFILPDLPMPGTYTILVEGDGYLTQVRKVHLTAKRSGTPLEIQTQSDGGSVEGTVLDDSTKGIAGAGLTLSSAANTYKTMSSSDGQGSFRFDGIEPGSYVLSSQAFGHETAFAQVKVSYGRTSSAALVMTTIDGNGLVATSYIRGRATDATTGGPITCPHIRANEQCRVTATIKVRHDDGTSETVRAHADPDQPYLLPKSGSVPALLPGRYVVTIVAPGYEPSTVAVDLPMGAIVDAATVALQPSPSVTGNVLARVGAVPSGTCIIAVPSGDVLPAATRCAGPINACSVSPVVADAVCAFADTAAMGSYSIDRLSAGTYQVRTITPDDSEYLGDPNGLTLVLGPGDVKRYDPTLDRLGRIGLTVLASNGIGSLQPASGAAVKITDVAGNPAGNGPTSADTTGYVLLTRLSPSVFTITATATNSVSGTLTGLAVGLNQEISAQLVLTTGIAHFSSQVVTQLSAGAQTPVEAATVTITGVTGYQGTLGIRSTTAPSPVTGGDGYVRICTSSCGPTSGLDPSEANLGLVEDKVDVKVTAVGYQTFSASEVNTASLQTITLNPSGVPFHGKVTLEGLADPAQDAADLWRQVRFTVLSAPPGVGDISLSAGAVEPGDPATANVIWSDSAQGTNPAGGRMLRPGAYRVSATLDGFNSDTIEFQVDPGNTMTGATFLLKKFGQLRVEAASDATPSVAIPDPVMSITMPDGTNRRIEADPGTNFVDFGTLPTGVYAVQLRAAGYLSATLNAPVDAGQTIDEPVTLKLKRLTSLRGNVVSELAPDWHQSVPGAIVTAELQESPNTQFTGTTSTEGDYRITGQRDVVGLLPGQWKVSANAGTGYDSPGPSQTITAAAAGSALVDLDQTVPTLVLTPKKGELRVTVYDEATTLITNASVSLTYSDDNGVSQIAPLTCQAGTPDCLGFYGFRNLIPITYMVNVYSIGHATVTLPVTVAPGEVKSLTVVLARPSGSIQGVVTAPGPVPADEAIVSLYADGQTTALKTDTTNSSGVYSFTDVPQGTYRVVVVDADGVLSAERSLTVYSAQSVTLDFTLIESTSRVVTTLSSAQGFDLTGALVSLRRADGVELGVQPAARSGDDAVAIFPQVPAGAWTATVSGPAGHLGATTKTFTVTAGSDAAVPITVNETQIRLHAKTNMTGVSSLPDTVTAHVKMGSADPVDVVVPVADTETAVYVNGATATTVTGSAGDWTVSVAPTSVPAGAVSRPVVLTVEPKRTITAFGSTQAISVSLNSSGTGTSEDITFTVRTPSGEPAAAGTVTAELRDGTTWHEVGHVTLTTTGPSFVTAQIPGSQTPGATQLRLRYDGDGEWKSSSSVDPLSITVNQDAVLTFTEESTVLKATIGPNTVWGHGTLSIQRRNGGGNWTDVASSTTAGEVTFTKPAPGAEAVTYRAEWDGDANYEDKTSGNITLPAAPPPPDPSPPEPGDG